MVVVRELKPSGLGLGCHRVQFPRHLLVVILSQGRDHLDIVIGALDRLVGLKVTLETMYSDPTDFTASKYCWRGEVGTREQVRAWTFDAGIIEGLAETLLPISRQSPRFRLSCIQWRRAWAMFPGHVLSKFFPDGVELDAGCAGQRDSARSSSGIAVSRLMEAAAMGAFLSTARLEMGGMENSVSVAAAMITHGLVDDLLSASGDIHTRCAPNQVQ